MRISHQMVGDFFILSFCDDVYFYNDKVEVDFVVPEQAHTTKRKL